MLHVVDVRYQAGRFGSGFKPRPKSDAGIREIPLAPLVVEAIREQLPPAPDPDALVFTGPGGGNHVAFGARTVLSRHGIRRMYQTTVRRADLDHLDLRGPHDFRHAFSTWLEGARIPARVIDELMGHQQPPRRLGRRQPDRRSLPPHHRRHGPPSRRRSPGTADHRSTSGRGHAT